MKIIVAVDSGLKNPLTKYNKKRREAILKSLADAASDVAYDLWTMAEGGEAKFGTIITDTPIINRKRAQREFKQKGGTK